MFAERPDTPHYYAACAYRTMFKYTSFISWKVITKTELTQGALRAATAGSCYWRRCELLKLHSVVGSGDVSRQKSLGNIRPISGMVTVPTLISLLLRALGTSRHCDRRYAPQPPRQTPTARSVGRSWNCIWRTANRFNGKVLRFGRGLPNDSVCGNNVTQPLHAVWT